MESNSGQNGEDMARGLAFAVIGFLIVVVGIGAYLAGKSGVSIKVSTPTTSVPAGGVSSPTPTPTDEIPAIKAAILSKLNTDETQVRVSVDTLRGNLAKGTVGGSGGGGYFLAAKTASGWTIIYDGQSQPPCDKVNAYNFPVDMVPECVDTNFKVITR